MLASLGATGEAVNPDITHAWSWCEIRVAAGAHPNDNPVPFVSHLLKAVGI